MSDPFDLLGLEPTFALDADVLAARHRELSLALHPDRFAGRPASERRAALSRAIEVNAALRSLRNPVTRAEALLSRLVTSGVEGAEPEADPEFLFEVMEQREGLAAAGRARNRAKLEELLGAQGEAEKKLIARLEVAFRQLTRTTTEGAPPAPGEVEEILATLGRLRYVRRFVDEAEALLDDLD